MATRQTITKKSAAKNIAVVEAALADFGPYPFPKRSDFFFDFPRGVDFGVKGAAGNPAGVAASWSDEKVRAARLQKNGVKVTFNGETREFRSVKEAFREFRLPIEKHIKFRGVLKASKKEAFTSAKGEVYMFTLVEAAE
ncbi:hypothetical protein AB4Y32_03380 [Paraburkholderia phymatum]|uniref:Uncharacterized protein n=1 Tax=Paraburkholderia phymatum TaxID=148447 RepID=A0ACC6TTZ7_9BURK